MSWLDKLMKDVDKIVEEATRDAGSGDTVIRGNGTVVTQDGDGTYVNGRKVAEGGGSIQIGNGGVWINGKRVS